MGTSTAGSSIVDHARTLLAVLTTLGTFGAGVSFSALNSGTSLSRTLLAWSFSAFIFGSAETLIFQVALVADFCPHTEHRAYRSETGILTGMGVGFAAVLAGTLCLTLSMTTSLLAGVRAAGLAVSFLLAITVAASLVRLAYTIWRRRVHSAGINGPASIAMQTPRSASVVAVHDVPEERVERRSPRDQSCSSARDAASFTREELSCGGCIAAEGTAGGAIESSTSDDERERDESHTAPTSVGLPTGDAAGNSHPGIRVENCLPTDSSVCADNVWMEPDLCV